MTREIMPPAPAEAPAGRRVPLDVREDIASGREPFVRIMTTVRSLGPGEVLVLRTPFEPHPLYGVLGKRGFSHWTEQLAPDDWRVWFYRMTAPASAATAPAGGHAVVQHRRMFLDVRGMEPPEPMVRVLEEADTLQADDELEVSHDRRPMFLYGVLEERGFAHETAEPEPGLVRIRIRRVTS